MPSIRYYTVVRVENLTLPVFFTLSLVVHLALVPLLGRKPLRAVPRLEPISVSFLPAPSPTEANQTTAARPPPTRRQKEPSRTKLRRPAPVVENKPAPHEPQPDIRDLPLPPQLAARSDPAPVAPQRPAVAEPPRRNDQTAVKRGPAQREVSIFRKDNAAKSIGREQLLPGIRDLGAYNRPIPLNTRDPILAPFTKKIESWIEAQWEYPDLAKYYGLQGKVTLEFTVLQDGHIDLLSVVRSSGSNLLDEEAVRAVKAAAPFPPIPPSIAAHRLRIIAGFTYLNNRVALTNNP